MDPEQYYRLSIVSSPAVSPDGDRIAYLATEFDGDDDERHTSLFVAPADGSEEPHRLTRASDAGDPKWGPDGRYLAFTAAREEDTELAVGPDEEEYLERVEEDGPVEIERLQHKHDGVGWLDGVTAYLFVVDVATRETARLDAANDRGYGGADGGLQPAWGDDRIAFVASDADDPDDTAVRDVFTIRPDGAGRERLTDGDLAVRAPRWGPAGERLAFLGRDPENFYVPIELYVGDPDGDYRSVSASLDRTLGYAGFRWLDRGTLLGAIGDGGWTRLCRFDADTDDPDRVFGAQSRYETVGGLDARGGTVAAVLSGHDAGRDLYAMDADDIDGGGDPRTRITAANEGLIAEYDQPGCRRLT